MSTELIALALAGYVVTVAATFPIEAFLDPARDYPLPWRWRFGIACFTWPGGGLLVLMVYAAARALLT